jgi:hypothetical protein
MINFYTNNTRENLQSFTGMPAQFNARRETQLLDHQRNKHTLRSQETVFDVMCRDPVNQANVESLARIMKQFLEKREEYHLELSLENLAKLHRFTQSVLKLPQSLEKTAITQLLTILPTQYVTTSFQATGKTPLDLIFSAQVPAEVQKNVMMKMTRQRAGLHKAAGRDERWQRLLSGADMLLPDMNTEERRVYLDILMHETDYETAEVSIFKLLREIVKRRFHDNPDNIKPFRLLPKIQFLFPSSPQFLHYFKLVDLVAQFFDYPKSENGDERLFLQELFRKLQNENCNLEALQRTATILGRLLYNQSSPSPIQFTRDFSLNVEKLKNVSIDIAQALSQHCNPQALLSDFSGVLLSQGTLVNRLASLLVLPKNGAINRCLISDLLTSLSENESSAYFGDFHAFYERLEKVLTELRDRPTISDLLRDVPVPTCTQGLKIVRASCGLELADFVRTEHVSRTIVSGLFTDWRQNYFGSCHTTAPIRAISQIALPLLVRDWKEIIQTGLLRREFNGEPIVFQAPVELYPMLDKMNILNQAKEAKEARTCAVAIAHLELFKTARNLLKYPSEEQYIETIMKFLESNRDKESFSARALIEALRPENLKDQHKFDAILYRLNSLYQHPLLQCWQNCLMGMHYAPLNILGLSTLGFRESLRTAFEKLAQTKKLDPNPFTDTGWPMAKPQCKAIQALRFRTIPSQDVQSDHAIVELYEENSSEPLKPRIIDSKVKFDELLQGLFTKITGVKLKRADTGTLVEDFKLRLGEFYARAERVFTQKPLPLETRDLLEQQQKQPWRFAGNFDFSESAFYKLYFQTPPITGVWSMSTFAKGIAGKKELTVSAREASRLLQSKQSQSEIDCGWEIDFTKDWPTGVAAFRAWLQQQKEYFGNIEGLMIPCSKPGHIFNAVLSEQMLEDPEPNSLDWMENRQAYLENLSWNDPELKDVAASIDTFILKDILPRVAKDLPDDQKTKLTQEIAAIPKSKFLEWYKQLGSVWSKFGLKFFPEDGIYTLLMAKSPQLKKHLVYKFADMNGIGYANIKQTQFSSPEYAFALRPTLQGAPQWEIMKLLGRNITKLDKAIPQDNIPFFKPLTFPGKYFETAANPNLVLGADKIFSRIGKYNADIISSFIAPQETSRAVLNDIEKKFLEEIEELSRRYDFHTNPKLAAEMIS